MRVLAAFDMSVNYAQIALHRPDAPEFFDLWTQADVDRGHIARDGHVVFGVPDHDGVAGVTVMIADAPSSQPDDGPAFEARADGVVVATPVGFRRRCRRAGRALPPDVPDSAAGRRGTCRHVCVHARRRLTLAARWRRNKSAPIPINI